jgi:RES domain-containing protein
LTLAWRLCRRPFADLSGEGARLVGGRWNSPGRLVVYASEDAALAVLEVRVHLDLDFSLLPADYALMAIDLDELLLERLDACPADTVAFGDAWLASRRSPVLSVPSAIVPESRDLLLNVAHPDAQRARIASIRSFSFDERLWRAGAGKPTAFNR